MTGGSQIMLFIGVTTGGSFINRLFPVWAERLGLGAAELRGVDLPPGAAPGAVRAVVDGIAAEPAVRGALVTTHKIAVLQHARERFVELDHYARRLGEVSAIARRDEGLAGFALDPPVSGAALDELLPRSHWQDHPQAQALIMGAGGAGVALAAGLCERPPGERPARIGLSDVDPARLELAERHLDPLDRAGLVHLQKVAGPQDDLLAALPDTSLVVNATGLGKDRPGSPLTAAALFPTGSQVWELNYRGPRPFLAQACAQAEARGLRVADGWTYFLRGWAAAIALVFERPIEPTTLAALGRAAEALRDGAGP